MSAPKRKRQPRIPLWARPDVFVQIPGPVFQLGPDCVAVYGVLYQYTRKKLGQWEVWPSVPSIMTDSSVLTAACSTP